MFAKTRRNICLTDFLGLSSSRDPCVVHFNPLISDPRTYHLDTRTSPTTAPPPTRWLPLIPRFDARNCRSTEFRRQTSMISVATTPYSMTLLRKVITDIKRPLDAGAGAKRKEWWVLWLTGVFFAIGLVSIVNHSMWADEMQAWLIAARSNSLLDMVNNAKHEGHPLLWHFGLYVLSRFSPNPVLMQVYHISLATGSVFLVARFAPFTVWQRILFAFGYYPFFEYAVISRCYALGGFLLFLFCVVWVSSPKRWGRQSIILLLLANTSVYGTLMALALALAIYGREARSFLGKATSSSAGRIGIVAGIAFGLVTVSAVCVQVAPALAAWNLGKEIAEHLRWERILNTPTIIWRAFAPLPMLQFHCWNTNILITGPKELEVSALGLTLVLALSAAILVCSLLTLSTSRLGFEVFVLMTAFFLAFSLLKLGYVRHNGNLFLAYIAALWLARSPPGRETGAVIFGAFSRSRWNLERAGKLWVTCLLAVQVMPGIGMSIHTAWNGFSNDLKAATCISEQGLEDVPIISYDLRWPSSISGYLQRPLYCIGNRVYFWARPMQESKAGDLDGAIRRLLDEGNSRVVVVQSHPWADLQNFAGLKIRELGRFDTAVFGEIYFIYLLQKQ